MVKNKFTNTIISETAFNAASEGKQALYTKIKRAVPGDNLFVVDAIDVDWGGLSLKYINQDYEVSTVSSDNLNEGLENGAGIISSGYLLELIGKSLERLNTRISAINVGTDPTVLEEINDIITELKTGEGPNLETLLDKLKGLGDKTVIQYVTDYVDGIIRYGDGEYTGQLKFVTRDELTSIINEIESTKTSVNTLNSKVNGVKSDMASLEQRLNDDISNIANENNINIHYGDTNTGETDNTLYINTIGSSSQSSDTTPVHKANVTINIQNGYSPSTQTVKVEEGKSATWSVYPSTGFKLPTTVTNGTIYSNTVKSRKVTSADTSFTVTVECVSLSDSPNTDGLEDFTI